MAITNAQLAQQVSELMDYWRTRDLQFAEWLGGTPTGGPYGDGRYPLSDYLAVIQYLYCPAALESGVTSSASSAAAQAALAGASKDQALAAQAAAEVARTLADTYRTAALAARDLALSYRNEAASSEANSLVHRNKARDWASKAVDVVVESGLYSARHYATKASETYASLTADITEATSDAIVAATASATASAAAAESSRLDAAEAQAAAAAARNLAQGYATNAQTSAADAAASAAAAQTWNPANYAALAGATFTGLVRLSYNTPDFIINAMDAPADNRRFRIRVNASGQVQFGFTSDDLQSATNWLAVSRSGITPTVTFGVPLQVESAGNTTAGRNTEWKTAGQPNVGFSSYNGSWRPAITIQGQTSAHHMFLVGPDSASSDALTNARIHSSRGLVLSTTGDYLYHRNVNGSVYYDETGVTRKGYVYHDSSGFGLLGSPGGWAVRIPPGTNRVEIPGSDIRSDYFYGLSDPGKYIAANANSFTYGSMFVGGGHNGYVGLVLYEGVRNVTLMSSGAARGQYCQATNAWDWYCTDGYMYIGRVPYQTAEGSGGGLFRMVQGQSGGRVWIQQGGSPQGSQEGDVTLIW